jgi:hypothetical protein
MRKIIYILAAIVFCINAEAQIPDPCTGAAALQAVDVASPCNCSEAQAGTSCNKSVYATKGAADIAINSYLVPQGGYGQPTLPVPWQDVRSDNMMVNAVIKHEFSTEFTTGPSTTTVGAINICQVKSTCNAVCQGYKIIQKSGGTCGTNVIAPTLVASTLDPTVFYRQYTVTANTTYIISRQIFYDFNTGGCSTSWVGSDGSASGGAKITAQHWFLWSSGGVLALNDLKLSARQLNENVMLNWSAIQENDNAKFEIEKSIDAIVFNKVGDVLSKGNTTTQNNYWAEDNKPNAINYYRLKAIAKDGKATYSTVVKIALQSNVFTAIIISPNPVVNTATVYYDSKVNNVSEYTILNTNGNTMLKGKISLQKGINKISQNVMGLAAGTYLFVINAGGERVTAKLVKE